MSERARVWVCVSVLDDADKGLSAPASMRLRDPSSDPKPWPYAILMKHLKSINENKNPTKATHTLQTDPHPKPATYILTSPRSPLAHAMPVSSPSSERQLMWSLTACLSVCLSVRLSVCRATTSASDTLRSLLHFASLLFVFFLGCCFLFYCPSLPMSRVPASKLILI